MPIVKSLYRQSHSRLVLVPYRARIEFIIYHHEHVCSPFAPVPTLDTYVLASPTVIIMKHCSDASNSVTGIGTLALEWAEPGAHVKPGAHGAHAQHADSALPWPL